MIEPFIPPWWAKNPVLQTLMGQLATRTWGPNPMVVRAKGELVRVSRGVTLEAFYTPQPAGKSRGLAILLSGWEGHAGAPYMVSTGRTLYAHGYEVFRINYPDHGNTHELTEALFNFGMVEKVHEALLRVVSSIRTRPVYLVGFSVGGNFALQIARRGVPGLKVVVGISPALDLERAVKSLSSSMFQGKFLRSWKRSLEKKAALFPHRYRFPELAEIDALESMAVEVLQAEGRNISFEEYAALYSLPPRRLAQLTAVTHVITSIDDPILGPMPYEKYEGIPKLSMWIQKWGGHVGFVRHPFSRAWYEDALVRLFHDERPPLPEGSTEDLGVAVP